MKRCSKCGETKPREAFSKNRAERDGLQRQCNGCMGQYRAENRKRNNEQNRQYREANRERIKEQRQQYREVNRERIQAQKRQNNYGVTPEAYAAMLFSQANSCGICGTQEPGGIGGWHIDHDHACCAANCKSCGKCVRGVLCHYCNVALGNFGDDPAKLEAAITYLRNWQAKKAA